MIVAQFDFNLKSHIFKIMLNGHSEFSSYGNDIVCAAVSGQVAMLELGLLSIGSYSIIKTEGSFCVDHLDTQAQVLAKAFYLALLAIEKKYQDNVKVTTKLIKEF